MTVHVSDHIEEAPMVRRGPIVACFFMVIAVTVTVFWIVQSREDAPIAAKPTIETIGAVDITVADNGDLAVARAGDGVAFAVYPHGPNQFIAGALRSIARLNGESGVVAGRYDVVRAGRNLVFLRDPQSGNEITLNAFGQVRTTEFLTAFGVRENIGGRS